MTQVSLVKREGDRRSELVAFVEPKHAVVGRDVSVGDDAGWVVEAVYATMTKADISPWDPRIQFLRG